MEVRCADQILVFDLGSGLRALGDASAQPMRATLFVSHYHYDHVQGLPFFGPIYNPANSFVICGPSRDGHTIKDILSQHMTQPYFPVTDAAFRAKVDYRPFEAGSHQDLGEARIRATELNHPGGNLAYRVDYKGRSVVYATDIEHGTEADARLAEFAQGADLFIVDAMYTDDEYHGRGCPPRTGWGHQTFAAAIEAANRASAKKLVLFHHDPAHTDKDLDRFLRDVRRRRPEAISARESMELWV